MRRYYSASTRQIYAKFWLMSDWNFELMLNYLIVVFLFICCCWWCRFSSKFLMITNLLMADNSGTLFSGWGDVLFWEFSSVLVSLLMLSLRECARDLCSLYVRYDTRSHVHLATDLITAQKSHGRYYALWRFISWFISFVQHPRLTQNSSLNRMRHKSKYESLLVFSCSNTHA